MPSVIPAWGNAFGKIYNMAKGMKGATAMGSPFQGLASIF